MCHSKNTTTMDMFRLKTNEIIDSLWQYTTTEKLMMWKALNNADIPLPDELTTFGEWAVTPNGDVVNWKNGYTIHNDDIQTLEDVYKWKRQIEEKNDAFDKFGFGLAIVQAAMNRGL